jgi:hypothetical protein
VQFCFSVVEVVAVVFSMVPAGVGVSAATEAGLAAEKAAGVAAGSPALLGVMHMGGDADSVVFAQVLRAVAAEFVGIAGEHVAARAGFSGAQSLAAGVTVASEAVRAAATTI